MKASKPSTFTKVTLKTAFSAKGIIDYYYYADHKEFDITKNVIESVEKIFMLKRHRNLQILFELNLV